MPEFIYVDENDHAQTVTHRMLYSTGIVCASCGLDMWRKPQSFAVNWSGLRPSQGELHPNVRDLIDGAPQRRAEFEGIHEEHEKHG